MTPMTRRVLLGLCLAEGAAALGLAAVLLSQGGPELAALDRAAAGAVLVGAAAFLLPACLLLRRGRRPGLAFGLVLAPPLALVAAVAAVVAMLP